LHELSLCRSIADLVEAAAVDAGCTAVRRIRLEIGVAAPVEIEAIHFCLPLCLADTRAAQAEILIDRPDLQMKCRSCDTIISGTSRLAPCPACGGRGGEILAGDEMRVLSIDVD
jgi:hydrogenase nickel incorporation protein HypA/HybF